MKKLSKLSILPGLLFILTSTTTAFACSEWVEKKDRILDINIFQATKKVNPRFKGAIRNRMIKRAASLTSIKKYKSICKIQGQHIDGIIVTDINNIITNHFKTSSKNNKKGNCDKIDHNNVNCGGVAYKRVSPEHTESIDAISNIGRSLSPTKSLAPREISGNTWSTNGRQK